MKTQKRILKKVSQFFCLALMVTGIQSCETEIPFEDNIPPEFLFRISGAGAEYTFDQDFDFDNYFLILKTDETYNVTFSGGDGGGLKSIKWTFTNNGCFRYDDATITSQWNTREVNGRDVMEWEGDRRNPVTGSILNLDLTTGVGCNNTYTSFDFELSDFGGELSMPNTISKRLTIYRSRGRFLVRRKTGR